MKYIFVIFLIIYIFASNVYANQGIAFEDIEQHWAKNEINLLMNESVIDGYGDNTFRPNDYITISEFLKVLIEMADYKLETIGDRWPNWYIETAIKNELIKNGDFENYSKNITRYEATKIISKYIDVSDISNSKNIFTDLKADEKETVLKLVNLGVINGYTDKTFKGECSITRAEACKVIINAYKTKQKLLEERKYNMISELTNLNNNEDDGISNTYNIKNNRIYIYDKGRYANLNGQTLNQEYIKDKVIIKVLESLIGEESYTELKFVPDKYIINSLNICYRSKKSDVTSGAYIFEIKFYENGYYDVASSKGIPEFMQNATIKIRTGKMWEKHFDFETESSCSERNLFELREAIGAILGNDVKNEFIEYIVEKRIQAGKIPNSDIPKISEVKKIGKYTINTFCMNDKDIEIFIQKF